MSISFDNIPVTIRTPGQFIEYNNSRAVQGSPAMPNVALIIGQRLAAGSVAAEVPTLVARKALGETYFGHGSIMAMMIDAFKDANPYTELWAIALDDDATGTAATGTFVFAGAATEAGAVYTYIGGERIVTVIPDATTAAQAGPLVDADITAHLLTSNLPVSSGAATVTVTITALHKGVISNSLKLEQNYQAGEVLPAGLTCTTTTIGGVVAGLKDPDVADAIAVFSDTWYNKIISAYGIDTENTNVSVLEIELLARWGPMVMHDGQAYVAVYGNQGALTTFGNAQNSQFSSMFGVGLSPTPPWVAASIVGAVDAGEPDPARPRQQLLLTGFLAPKPADRFTRAEREILLSDGISTFTISRDGDCYLERLITTYQTNAGGIVDPSYLDITTMHTLAYLRYTWQVRVALRYPRHKLADDGTEIPPGQPIVTPSLLRTEAIALFLDTWVPKGVVEAATLEQFKTDALFERNSSDTNRVDMRMSPDLMNQFMVMAGQIQYLL